jgi:hypothetical protein
VANFTGLRDVPRFVSSSSPTRYPTLADGILDRLVHNAALNQEQSFSKA